MYSKIGILGGGQLGKMLCQAGSRLGLDITLMDKSVQSPGGTINPNFIEGDITNYQDTLRFGQDYDVITIEIEKVNTEALKELENSGKHVYPQPNLISLIQDKGKQNPTIDKIWGYLIFCGQKKIFLNTWVSLSSCII